MSEIDRVFAGQCHVHLNPKKETGWNGTTRTDERVAHKGLSLPAEGSIGRGDVSAESGSGTILVASLLALAAALALVIAYVGAIYTARARLDATADLAALAGADVSATAIWEDVGERPCEESLAVAKANDAQLESCEVIGADTRVIVTMKGDGLNGFLTLRSQARAGPVSASGSSP